VHLQRAGDARMQLGKYRVQPGHLGAHPMALLMFREYTPQVGIYSYTAILHILYSIYVHDTWTMYTWTMYYTTWSMCTSNYCFVNVLAWPRGTDLFQLPSAVISTADHPLALSVGVIDRTAISIFLVRFQDKTNSIMNSL
jgi:hypothetical protein